MREKTPGERMMMAIQMSEFVGRMQEAGERARHPEASEREIMLRAAAYRIPKDLMIQACGWHPDLGPYREPGPDKKE